MLSLQAKLFRVRARMPDALLRRTSTTAGAAGTFEKLMLKLSEALESVRYVEQSADQAYLEVEPSERGFKEVYVMRYQTFARDHLDQALNSYEDLKKQLGDDVFHAGGPEFRLMVADSQLARDQLNHALRKGEQILKDKAAGVLHSEELRHCAPPFQ